MVEQHSYKVRVVSSILIWPTAYTKLRSVGCNYWRYTVKSVAILKNFFGFLPGQSLTDFAKELRALSPEEKAELVALAAIELGVEVEN